LNIAVKSWVLAILLFLACAQLGPPQLSASANNMHAAAQQIKYFCCAAEKICYPANSTGFLSC
jgi:hypothetical protein